MASRLPSPRAVVRAASFVFTALVAGLAMRAAIVETPAPAPSVVVAEERRGCGGTTDPVKREEDRRIALEALHTLAESDPGLKGLLAHE